MFRKPFSILLLCAVVIASVISLCYGWLSSVSSPGLIGLGIALAIGASGLYIGIGRNGLIFKNKNPVNLPDYLGRRRKTVLPFSLKRKLFIFKAYKYLYRPENRLIFFLSQLSLFVGVPTLMMIALMMGMNGGKLVRSLIPFFFLMFSILSVCTLYIGFRRYNVQLRLLSCVSLFFSLIGGLITAYFVFHSPEISQKSLGDVSFLPMNPVIGIYFLTIMAFICLSAAIIYAYFINNTRAIERRWCIIPACLWIGLLCLIAIFAFGDQSAIYPFLACVSLFVFISEIAGKHMGVSVLRMPSLSLSILLTFVMAKDFFFLSPFSFDFDSWRWVSIAFAFFFQYMILCGRSVYLMRFLHALTALLLTGFIWMVQRLYISVDHDIFFTGTLTLFLTALIFLCSWGSLHHPRFTKVYLSYVAPLWMLILSVSMGYTILVSHHLSWLHLPTIGVMGLYVSMRGLSYTLRQAMWYVVSASLMLWITASLVSILRGYYHVDGAMIQGLLHPSILICILPAWAIWVIASYAGAKFLLRR